MSLVRINKPRTQNPNGSALFQLGFRPFFIGASVFAAVSVTAWLLILGLQLPVRTAPLTLFQWHAHEMIYGFSMAVIAGFLLTAVMNWTGIQTLRGGKLKLLFSAWLIPRILLLPGTSLLWAAAVFDLFFAVGLLAAVLAPVLKTRQWHQLGIVLIVALLALGNLCFYLEAFQLISRGAFLGNFGGLFVIVGLILTIGGRVLPGFISNGLDRPVHVKNPFWLAALSLSLLFCFAATHLFWGAALLSGSLAALLFLATSYRLYCWHVTGLWRVPLLWGLYSAFLFINLGFFLFVLHFFIGSSPFPAVHALAVGGIGLSTLAMMTRVSLGHTGRDIRNPPRAVTWFLSLLLLGAGVRVLLPLVAEHYNHAWIMLSQVFWIGAFLGFAGTFFHILRDPRIDGQPG